MRSELGWEVRSLKLTSASFFFFQVPDGGFAVRFFFFGHGPVRALSGISTFGRPGYYPPITRGTTIGPLSLRSHWVCGGGFRRGCGTAVRIFCPGALSFCAWLEFPPPLYHPLEPHVHGGHLGLPPRPPPQIHPHTSPAGMEGCLGGGIRPVGGHRAVSGAVIRRPGGRGLIFEHEISFFSILSPLFFRHVISCMLVPCIHEH